MRVEGMRKFDLVNLSTILFSLWFFMILSTARYNRGLFTIYVARDKSSEIDLSPRYSLMQMMTGGFTRVSKTDTGTPRITLCTANA